MQPVVRALTAYDSAKARGKMRSKGEILFLLSVTSTAILTDGIRLLRTKNIIVATELFKCLQQQTISRSKHLARLENRRRLSRWKLGFETTRISAILIILTLLSGECGDRSAVEEMKKNVIAGSLSYVTSLSAFGAGTS